MRTLPLISCVLLLFNVPAAAQSGAPADSHQQAAAELVEVLRLEDTIVRSREVMMESMISQNPALGQFRNVFKDFYAKYLRWEDLLPEYVRIYREAYTEAEIRQLIEFYRTPVGRKTVEVQPRLMAESSRITQAMIQPHMPELMRTIQEQMMGGGG